MELQVQEDAVPLGTESDDGLGSGRAEQLESDLGHAEPRAHALGQAEGDHQIVDVESQSEAVARFTGHGHPPVLSFTDRSPTDWSPTD